MDETIRQTIKEWMRMKERSQLAWKEWQSTLAEVQRHEQALLGEMMRRGWTQKKIQLGERGTLVFQEHKEYENLTHHFLKKALQEYVMAVQQKTVGLDTKSAYQYICSKRGVKKSWKPMIQKKYLENVASPNA